MGISRGDLAEHFGREWRRLSDWVRRRLDDSAEREGEDIVHEVYATLFENPDDLGIENLSAYVYTALRHKVIDRIRRRRPVVSLDAPLGGELEGMTLSDILPAPFEHPLDSREREEMARALRNALEELDEASRAIVVLTEFEGRTFRELSEEWQVPIGTLLSRKSRALRRLAVALAEHRT
jgi:RNA polymerase sigma factor (sigma-70 family)